MVDIDRLKQHPEEAGAEDVRELIRLLELARSSLPRYETGEAVSPDGEIGDIKSAPR